MILIIETSAQLCSSAIADEQGNVIAEIIASEENAHAEKLPGMVSQVIANAGITLSELSAVGISRGPGSYTGLRIGTSLAKGICYASGVPLISLNGLRGMAMAATQKYQADLYAAHLDARRNEVYMEVFNAAGDVVKPLGAIILDAGTFEEFPGKQWLICGNSNEKIQSICTFGRDPEYLDTFPVAANLVEEAANKFKQKQWEDLAYFEPLYLKDFIPGITKKFSV